MRVGHHGVALARGRGFMRSLSHLREDARWCVFREVASNTIPGDRTIVVYECECRIAIRLIETEAPSQIAGPDVDAPAAVVAAIPVDSASIPLD